MPSFDIAKATEKAKFTLAKRQAPSTRAQVAILLDISGSTADLYRNGLMQRCFESTLPVANVVDLNAEMDVYAFADGSNITHVNTPATIANYSDYVKRYIIGGPGIGGGTSYAPVIEAALRDFGFFAKRGGFFGGGKETLTAKSSKGDPVLVYLLTDGENDDKAQTTRLFEQMEQAKSAFYVLFVGVGTGTTFKYIDELGTRFGNVGFTRAPDVERFVNSDDLYDSLIPQEFTEWLAKSAATA